MSNYYMRRIFQLENYSVKKISQVYNEELGYYSNYLKSNYNMNKISNIISYIYRICFIWFIFKFDTNITIGSSIVIMEMNNEMLNNFMDNLDNILDITEALGDLWEALNQLKKAQVYHPQGTEIVHKIDGKISIKNLNFSFGNKKIFNNFSIEIPSGCKVAVIGTSGVGKSTLLGILSKLHEVNRNSVFIDDEDICNLDPTSIRNNIIYITQANSLLDSTINENILIGKIDATREEIERAATLAECNFINKLPQGYNTPVGTNGSNLSGGQIQRICIARSIVDFKKLNNSKLILCDEPISALDPFTAKAIIDKIIHIGDKKTMLWVDHSMHIAPLCDLVIMMTQDGIITGSHTDLMYKSSKYRQLFYPDSKNDITQNML